MARVLPAAAALSYQVSASCEPEASRALPR